MRVIVLLHPAQKLVIVRAPETGLVAGLPNVGLTNTNAHARSQTADAVDGAMHALEVAVVARRGSGLIEAIPPVTDTDEPGSGAPRRMQDGVALEVPRKRGRGDGHDDEVDAAVVEVEQEIDEGGAVGRVVEEGGGDEARGHGGAPLGFVVGEVAERVGEVVVPGVVGLDRGGGAQGLREGQEGLHVFAGGGEGAVRVDDGDAAVLADGVDVAAPALAGPLVGVLGEDLDELACFGHVESPEVEREFLRRGQWWVGNRAVIQSSLTWVFSIFMVLYHISMTTPNVPPPPPLTALNKSG